VQENTHAKELGLKKTLPTTTTSQRKGEDPGGENSLGECFNRVKKNMPNTWESWGRTNGVEKRGAKIWLRKKGGGEWMRYPAGGSKVEVKPEKERRPTSGGTGTRRTHPLGPGPEN